jgi:biopolymer transport protein TolQ
MFVASIFFSAYAQSDFFGKIVFWGLLSLSIISWTVLVNKIWHAHKLRQLCLKFVKNLEKKKETPFALNIDGEFAHPFLEIYLSLKHNTTKILQKNNFFKENKSVFLSQPDIDMLESCALATIAQEQKKLEKNLFLLPTIVTLGPFLGLLGTVWGILLTFSNLQHHAITDTSANVLSGLSLALTTTVLGLVVAIPALIAYNYIKSSVRDFIMDMEYFSNDLLTNIEIQYRKVE